MTRPYAEVIGDPIAHSKSPLIHNFWLQKLGIDAEYRACHVKPDELEDYFARRREDAEWRGCNITIPHKIVALQFADEIEHPEATNCLVPLTDGNTRTGLMALNTDVDGIEEALGGVHHPVCLIGAGGAARIAMTLMGVDEVRIVARNEHQARSMPGADSDGIRVYAFHDAAEALRGANTVVNATPLGMVGQPAMPSTVLDGLEGVNRDARVFDMVYAPLETELLARSRFLKLEPRDGLLMLVGQAARAFEFFFRNDAPRKYDAELRALLTA